MLRILEMAEKVVMLEGRDEQERRVQHGPDKGQPPSIGPVHAGEHQLDDTPRGRSSQLPCCSVGPLERHAHLHLIRARGDEMRPAECRQEVVKRFLIRDVDDAETDFQLRLVGMKKVIDAHANIE